MKFETFLLKLYDLYSVNQLLLMSYSFIPHQPDLRANRILSENAARLFIMLSFLLAMTSVYAWPPLQLYIELTPENGVLRPESGHYSGPVTITRPITIEGQGKVIVDAEGVGSVLTVAADNTVITGLELINSGNSFDDMDAGVTLKADKVRLEDNVIHDTLFGINIAGGNDNIVRHNRISSKDREPALRGDGLRMWNSHDNLITDNSFIKVRDLFLTNSEANRLENNYISHSRIGFELIFSHENELLNNTIEYNSTGFMVVYSNDLVIRKNTIRHLRSFAGSAMAFKESNNIQILDNKILHCAIGMSANAPLDPENIITMKNNQVLYNDIALYFYGERGGHVLEKNQFIANILDVQASIPEASFYNQWHGNYWDRYEGFDRNHDGIGDTPYQSFLWADRLWVDVPMTQFFRGTPILESIDFMERFTSFSDPAVMLQDPEPMINRP